MGGGEWGWVTIFGKRVGCHNFEKCVLGFRFMSWVCMVFWNVWWRRLVFRFFVPDEKLGGGGHSSGLLPIKNIYFKATIVRFLGVLHNI